MKKSKFMLFAAIAFIPPIPLIIAASNHNKNTNSTDNNNNLAPKIDKLYKNPIVNEMLNFYTNNNDDLRKNYVSFQENRSNALFKELEYSFTYYPIFISNKASDGSSHYSRIINKAKDAIQKHLSQDWYWVLNNLDHFWFIFSPYNDLYKTFEGEKELFEKVHNELGSWTTNIKNKKPEAIFKYKFPDASSIIKKWVDKNKDKYKNIDPKSYVQNSISQIESWYLIFDTNKAIKVLKYLEDGKPKLQILTDLLLFKESATLEEQILALENEINSKREKDLLDDIEEKIGEAEDYANDDNDANTEANEEGESRLLRATESHSIDINKVLTEFLKSKGDKKFFEFHAKHQYNSHFVDAINTINKDNLSIYRFTMRNIDYEK
ncbi:aromatic motif membrane protein [Mycoplasmopsis agalactiae]|uniref:Uncharacterized protein n=1 Tax=Mycoplasmopsis agalactiae (strain NCTC 10123 / CIP 59.7 / PG2) TaxID=347257 RepID=A5IYQ1_MYCAP|nr:aromatic motif membrane protein [Mycoplasmopsis agalactiae]MCE6057200.1 hypothetical protein [Mycoplasmopsis agalactiae]MCE6078986.1 hypothetical protein [Mycoplasmopsis agalactiae]MCE6095372.1 hypothetical protein [Mycoplasmopsis agalactiae]MCE6114629.1 hypothetical protein [Mycoplasmopsis agalactiae]NLS34531.1 hypothetical protein [Mycoplasmopsis agalactiae]